MTTTERIPAVEGWFTTSEPYTLIGAKCTACGTVVFPPRSGSCPSPDCDGTELEPTPLSRKGKVWSYTENHYAPPPPYVAAEPFEPYALAAVELEAEGIVILGQVAKGVMAADLSIGQEVEVDLQVLYRDDEGVDHWIWTWAPSAPKGSVMATERDLVVLGAGMHPWGKWGKNFVEYGLVAAKAALADADVAWRDIEFVAGADTIRNGYPGFVAGSTFSQAMGWTGAQISSSYAACASGAQAMQSARAQILAGFADVAMVIGADTTPKGFFAPVGGERKEDPDWQRFHLLGATNPAFFALNARRRIDVFGDTVEDFAMVKVKNSKAGVANPYARFRKEFTLDDFAGSPIVSDPLRLLDICATSDGAAAVIICTPEYAMKKLGTLEGTVRIRAVANTTPTYPQVRLELPDIATDSNAVVQAPALGFKDSIAHNAYEQAGLGPEDVSCAEVYDLSTALELDWYENLGFCAEGEGARLVRDGVTALGGSKPVNASGGLASFGEAIPAQAIAQVCELTWQLQGRCDGHQVENAKVGLAINQGLFGHGSCTILSV